MQMDSMLDMNRRSLMTHMLMLIGATAIPVDVALAAKPVKAKGLLTAAQLKLLSAVADTIVPATDTPGALAAGVPAKLDTMLAYWASAATKKQIVETLGRVDAAATAAGKSSFVALSAAQRDAVLRPYDAAALKSVPPPATGPKMSFFTQVPYVADPGYLKLKELVVGLYYTSEIAMTQELIYEHVPGEWQPSTKADANTRPWASTGPF